MIIKKLFHAYIYPLVIKYMYIYGSREAFRAVYRVNEALMLCLRKKL